MKEEINKYRSASEVLKHYRSLLGLSQSGLAVNLMHLGNPQDQGRSDDSSLYLDAARINNIELNRSLQKEDLYEAYLKSFAGLDVGCTREILAHAIAYADLFIKYRIDISYVELMEFDHAFDAISYLGNKLSNRGLDDERSLLEHFYFDNLIGCSRICINLGNKKGEFVLNESARFISLFLFYHSLQNANPVIVDILEFVFSNKEEDYAALFPCLGIEPGTTVSKREKGNNLKILKRYISILFTLGSSLVPNTKENPISLSQIPMSDWFELVNYKMESKPVQEPINDGILKHFLKKVSVFTSYFDWHTFVTKFFAKLTAVACPSLQWIQIYYLYYQGTHPFVKYSDGFVKKLYRKYEESGLLNSEFECLFKGLFDRTDSHPGATYCYLRRHYGDTQYQKKEYELLNAK